MSPTLALIFPVLLAAGRPPVTAPPETFLEHVGEKHREAARGFYRKHLDVKGLPIAASSEVADLALERTHDIVASMLAGPTVKVSHAGWQSPTAMPGA